MNPLKRLQDFGQSVWYDNIDRKLLRSGELSRMIKIDGFRGITSPPTNLEKSDYLATKGRDGLVSLEVSPDLAYDTDATVKEALRLRDRVSRPNTMIKVPATREGVVAFEKLVSEGLSINVTLLFSVERYKEVAEAYIAGLEARLRRGQSVEGLASVASFFVSRVDTAIDKLLDARIAQ